jgi:hypothetical protein
MAALFTSPASERHWLERRPWCFERRAWARRATRFARIVFGLTLIAANVTGCSDAGTEDGAAAPPTLATPAPELRVPAADALDELYARDHLVEVVIELDAADWQALRGEGRPLFHGFLEEEDETFVFTDYVGAATVDGHRYENVTVRKKGYLGSLSRPRPSLKLDFGEVEDAVGSAAGRVFERLTLNNNRGDYSRARTCLAYDLFAKAGVPAPRCNFAHVVVNGEDLGTYSNVEPITKPMLARNFGDASGKLYEGQLIDLVTSDVPRFELKTNHENDDRSELQLLATALEGGSGTLPERVGELLDLPRFREFWAAETLVGHWDGYSGNRNNYYLYDNPKSGRFELIPWGTDGAFARGIPGDAFNSGSTVYARAVLANRLYNLPEERAHFRGRLGALNEALWDETTLTRELQRISSLASDTLPGATASLAEHLRTRGVSLRAELRAKAPEWVQSANEASPCFGTISDVQFHFASDYGDLTDMTPGLGQFEVELRLDGVPVEVEASTWFGRAGVDAPELDPTIVLRALSVFEDGRGILLQISVPPEEFSPGARSLHGFETGALVVALDGDDSRFVGFISDGTLQLDAAGTAPGAAVRGRLDAKLLQTGCAALD